MLCCASCCKCGSRPAPYTRVLHFSFPRSLSEHALAAHLARPLRKAAQHSARPEKASGTSNDLRSCDNKLVAQSRPHLALILKSAALPFLARQLGNTIRHKIRHAARRWTAWLCEKGARMTSQSALMGSRPTIGVRRNGCGHVFAPKPAGTRYAASVTCHTPKTLTISWDVHTGASSQAGGPAFKWARAPSSCCHPPFGDALCHEGMHCGHKKARDDLRTHQPHPQMCTASWHSDAYRGLH